MIGNSKLHWAFFVGKRLELTWDTDYIPESVIQKLSVCSTLDELAFTIVPSDLIPQIHFTDEERGIPYPMVLASVVPSQTEIWQSYPNIQIITLAQVPLLGLYPTLGIDRALAVWGAGITWGFPILVIDAGTALTFTGVDDNQYLVGGAILPGLGLQLASLGQKTGQLPLIEPQLIQNLPPRFALNTPDAIQSGVIYTLLAGIKDFIVAWLSIFPESNLVITGGDRILLSNHLQMQFPEFSTRLRVEQNLIFWGMKKLKYTND